LKPNEKFLFSVIELKYYNINYDSLKFHSVSYWWCCNSWLLNSSWILHSLLMRLSPLGSIFYWTHRLSAVGERKYYIHEEFLYYFFLTQFLIKIRSAPQILCFTHTQKRVLNIRMKRKNSEVIAIMSFVYHTAFITLIILIMIVASVNMSISIYIHVE
jgi:hypothetical protein